ncbi:MAG: GGDEF domain-containing protein, partial [Clostridia bacterium]|nr:GGDEF domain-containing protein [Clostridia bacterium]
IILFTGALYFMEKRLKESRITLFRMIIMTGLMILLFFGMGMKLISDGTFFQPSIYILMLLAVSVVPFFNSWEIFSVVLPSQLFLTIYAVISRPSESRELLKLLLDTWGFVIIALIISSLFYLDRIRYFKQDLQLKKQNDLLKMRSEVDALTSVFNRRKLDSTMEMEWKRSSRTGKPFAFLLIDLDHFKNYNDTYGHTEGDICLRKTAIIMQKNLRRASDEIFRYGGEEFGVILPFTDVKSAQLVAERLRSKVEEAAITHEGTEPGVLTVSIGITSAVGDKDIQYQEMYIEADKALYAAKRAGRNRIISFEK